MQDVSSTPEQWNDAVLGVPEQVQVLCKQLHSMSQHTQTQMAQLQAQMNDMMTLQTAQQYQIFHLSQAVQQSRAPGQEGPQPRRTKPRRGLKERLRQKQHAGASDQGDTDVDGLLQLHAAPNWIMLDSGSHAQAQESENMEENLQTYWGKRAREMETAEEQSAKEYEQFSTFQREQEAEMRHMQTELVEARQKMRENETQFQEQQKREQEEFYNLQSTLAKIEETARCEQI